MADDPVITYKVDPGQVLQKALEKALEQVHDLTPAFNLITIDWFRSNAAIFTLKGPGKYIDLAPDSGMSKYDYKKAKLKAVGFIYPILKRTGVLESSITDPTDSNSVHLILNGNTLILGTKVPYAHFLQDGTKHMPPRPVIFTNGEQSSPSDQYNRSGAWKQIIQNYVKQVTAKVGEK